MTYLGYLGYLGDGPITSPSQVDDNLPGVGPTRVNCSDLPPDSPWRGPGQVCATDFNVVDMLNRLLGKLGQLLPTAPAAPQSSGPPVALLVGGAAVAAYFLMKKKKRT